MKAFLLSYPSHTTVARIRVSSTKVNENALPASTRLRRVSIHSLTYFGFKNSGFVAFAHNKDSVFYPLYFPILILSFMCRLGPLRMIFCERHFFVLYIKNLS